MELYIDSGDLEELKQAIDTGLISGVTTNPSLINKSLAGSKITFEQALKKICTMLRKQTTSFTVSGEVQNSNATNMIAEGKKLAKIDPNIIVKIPMTMQGMLAVKALKKVKIRTNVTLIFSANQALLAAKAGAFVVSPFMGRLDDAGLDSTHLIEEIRTMYDVHNYRTKILAASIRTPRHVTEAAIAGADIATIPPSIFHKLFKHSLTDQGIAQFDKDWQSYTSQ